MRILRGSFPLNEREAALTCGLPPGPARRGVPEMASSSVGRDSVTALSHPLHAQDRLESSDTFSGARTNQHAVAITIEAVASRDGVFVSGQNVLSSGKRADQREQRRPRQMKICEQALHHAEPEARNNEQPRLGVACKHKICRP